MAQNSAKTIITTIIALIAFAANSVLCRLALGDANIDAISFTLIRLLSGSIILMAIIMATKSARSTAKQVNGSWFSSLMLFVYALCFSLAYVTLDTATGALILFGAVQITMIMVSIFSGNRLHYSEWIGMFIAFIGFIYLILPTLTSPSLIGFVLMSISGIGWGIYSIRGRGSKNPLNDVGFNFIRTTPFLLILALVGFSSAQMNVEGILLAIISGAITSGLGYAIWYIALNGLSTTQAAVVQLSVPMLAALGGILFVAEVITLRFSLSALLILGGILIVTLGRYLLNKKA